MTLKEIVEQYLEDHGYDGLCSDNCGCGLEDGLIPCDTPCDDCEPAFAFRPGDEPDVSIDMDCDLYFAPRPPKCIFCGEAIDVTMPNSFSSLEEPIPRRRAHVECVMKQCFPFVKPKP